MSLFQTGFVTLHSGQTSNWKIDCDHLSDEDLGTIAMLIRDMIGPFAAVEGVPNGGLRLAKMLDDFRSPWTSRTQLLIVDDVLTTGASMEYQRAGRKAKGAVIFARGETPRWVRPLFKANGSLQ